MLPNCPFSTSIIIINSPQPLIFLPSPFSTGRLYSIQWCDDIVVGEWSGLPLGLGVGAWTDTNPPPATGRWYRIAPQVP